MPDGGHGAVVADKLATYRRKRDAARTREPVPSEGPLPARGDDTFVVQEHHARRLHWDFRLERGGVLVSWAVPKGLPLDPATNHLAVQTEDHPLEYAGFAGEIPAGEYGGGTVTIWDAGTYQTLKWTEREIQVVLSGRRVSGRYVLFRTGENWMMHRMDAPAAAAGEPLPELIRPMFAVAGPLPVPDEKYGFEMKWDGVRAVVYVQGGRARVLGRNDRDATGAYPEVQALAASLGSRPVVLDGEIVALDAGGRPSFSALQQRMHVGNAAAALRLASSTPVTYLTFDLLHLDGASTLELPYTERRSLLETLELNGPHWQTPPWFRGDGPAVLEASRSTGLEGVVAKRLDSTYLAGRRSDCWVKTKNLRFQTVVVGGWKAGTGRRGKTLGSLLLGVRDAPGGPLLFAGHVGTGFTEAMLAELRARLDVLHTDDTPFAGMVPRQHSKDATWARPTLVGEVAFTEWTPDGRLRHPAWRGLRSDIDSAEVTREP